MKEGENVARLMRKPTHPGEILKKEFLEPLVPYKKYFDIFSKNIFCSGKARLATTVFSDSFGLGITQSQLAKEIYTTVRTINEIVNEKRNISPEMAIRLSRCFGTSEELWLNLQNQYDLYMVKEKKSDTLKIIKPLKTKVAKHRELIVLNN